MKKLFAIAIPILPGKTAQFKKFTNDLMTTYASQFDESRKKLGVHERAFYQQTPAGDMVIVTLEGANPEKAFADFGKANDKFTQWFKKEVQEIHGVDLNSPPKGPLPVMVADSMSAVYQQ